MKDIWGWNSHLEMSGYMSVPHMLDCKLHVIMDNVFCFYSHGDTSKSAYRKEIHLSTALSAWWLQYISSSC